MFIKNPVLKYTYFPFNKQDDTAAFAILYHDSQTDIPKLINEVKEELNLSYFDYFFFAGKCGLSLKSAELHRVYEVVKCINTHGFRVYMQDGTETTFNVGDELDAISQQKKLCKSLTRFIFESDYAKNWGYDDFTIIGRIPAHRDVFWDIPEGKELAKKLRERFRLKDELNKDEMTIGEYFEEIKPTRVEDNKRKAPEPVDMCMVCLEAAPATMVLPCEHCVACKKCSDELKDTINKDKCIYCRRSITDVLD
jgi:hypothetical protein